MIEIILFLITIPLRVRNQFYFTIKQLLYVIVFLVFSKFAQCF